MFDNKYAYDKSQLTNWERLKASFYVSFTESSIFKYLKDIEYSEKEAKEKSEFNAFVSDITRITYERFENEDNIKEITFKIPYEHKKLLEKFLTITYYSVYKFSVELPSQSACWLLDDLSILLKVKVFNIREEVKS